MKNKIQNSKTLWVYLVMSSLLWLTNACTQLELEKVVEPYLPTSLNETGGNWNPFVLANGTEISVAKPADVKDASYVKELDSLKNNVVGKLSASQNQAVTYWGVGAVYRWNEIARELAARYNLPPASNAQGIYPVPDPANPKADPMFPFANPPYTARALAYLSVAQYDALITAWKAKYTYNRPAAYRVDSQVKSLLPASNLPAYPSEEAVVAQASYQILIAMFPGEIDYLKSKLEEAKNVGIWAGKNVTSDVTAGIKLGADVAAKVIARAKTDGMGASNNQTLVPGFIERAKGLGMPKLWESQEIPARPPMLPNYGAVKTWNYDRVTLEKIRPAKPYVEGSAEFQKDLDELRKIQEGQTREQARIANYWADGPGSYTPPGHWHRIAANQALEAKYSELKMAKLLAYIGTALMDAGISCWETKFYYYSPRPQQYGLKTSVGLPNFPSYTSGHSTFSFAGATVMNYFFPDNGDEFNKLAQEASDSRVYGLIHFRLDCTMGREHGKTIGSYSVSRAKLDGSN